MPKWLASHSISCPPPLPWEHPDDVEMDNGNRIIIPCYWGGGSYNKKGLPEEWNCLLGKPKWPHFLRTSFRELWTDSEAISQLREKKPTTVEWMKIWFRDFTRNNRVKSISENSHCKENSSIKENGMNQPGGTCLLIFISQKFLALCFLL